MKVFQKFLILPVILSALLWGAINVSAKGNDLSLITQIRINCHRENTTVTRVYVQPHKIEAVLNYLRLLKISSPASCDPEYLSGNSYEIILYDAAGHCSIYRQKANRFFSKNSNPWKKIMPEQASLLDPLIRSIPTDEKSVFH